MTLCSIAIDGLRHDPSAASDAATPAVWLLPEETPVAMLYNQDSFAVMLATPADLDDFALGFSLTERVLTAPAELEHLKIQRGPGGVALSMTIPIERAAALSGRRRAFEGRSGCGLCGVETLAEARRAAPPVVAPDIAPAALARALRDLSDAQPMRAVNFSVHGAGWCDRDGRILLVREDVGRHTALDKLIGAVAARGWDFRDGFVVLSSRCGYELVQKAAAVGIGLLATVSAPTSLAWEQAQALGLALAAADRGGRVMTL